MGWKYFHKTTVFSFTICFCTGSSYVKLFGKAQVDVNLSLGQFAKVKNKLLSFSDVFMIQKFKNNCKH